MDWFLFALLAILRYFDLLFIFFVHCFVASFNYSLNLVHAKGLFCFIIVIMIASCSELQLALFSMLNFENPFSILVALQMDSLWNN